MLDKESFINYIKKYEAFDEYLDKLANLNIDVWEDESCGWFRDCYVEMLCRLMDLEIGERYFNFLERYIYGYKDFNSIDELYDWFVSIKSGDNLKKESE